MLKWKGVRDYNFSMRRVDVIKIIMASVLVTSPLVSQYKPPSELVVSPNFLEAKSKKVISMDDVVNIIKTGRSQSATIDEVSILDLGDFMYNYTVTHRQIISSVDGLEAVVDSLKSDDATITENSVDRVFDYKIGSLSDGKDVYARVKAKNISRGGYSLLVYLYLVDRSTGDTLGVGGIGLSRWGMPYNTNPTNPQDGLYYAHLYEDVQTFIRALRVYEFDDRYVAFFSAQEDLGEDMEDVGRYNHIFNTYVFPKAKEGEEGWFKPYVGRIEIPGMKLPLKKVNDIFAKYNNYFTGTILAVLRNNGNVLEEYYGISFAVNEKTERSYAVIESTEGVDIPKDIDEWVILDSE